MADMLLNDKYLPLPDNIVEKLKGKNIEFIETAEGILLKIIENDPVSQARGCLKGSNFCTETYLKYKAEDRDMEK
ncbi:MAG: hypothetical protein ABRQ39_06510 [Candidatus Eremiobacterota bacterium]